MKVTYKFEVHESLWMTSNQRLHWGEKARRAALLRQIARTIARKYDPKGRPIADKATIQIEIGYPTRARVDLANAEPTYKPLLDGLITDGGALADDSTQHLTSLTLTRAKQPSRKHHHTINITITPQNEEQQP